ncbi:MAG TPA: hypothetical protein PKW33_20100 [Anaerolineaceae bacterium]|nr:hypothetical protein [Anaerolineaceae bacterium]HPN53909.1 hypothetical protein [Anaerolineaceae bacterium]
MHITWHSRQLTPIAAPPVEVRVEKLRWSALGGPARAWLRAWGRPADLQDLLGWLRCGVTISDSALSPLWWGYLSAVTVKEGRLSLGASLETSASRVAVLYHTPPAAGLHGGLRKQTDWAVQALQEAEYGRKEKLISLETATPAQAEARRTAALRELSAAPRLALLGSASDVCAELECCGWWRTLDWRLYACAEGPARETSAQAQDILAACGAFFTETWVEHASGVWSQPGRSGEVSAQVEAERLLCSGDAAGRRLLAGVLPGRQARLFAAPLAGEADWAVDAAGQIYDAQGQPTLLPPHGQWLKPLGLPWQAQAWVEHWEWKA